MKRYPSIPHFRDTNGEGLLNDDDTIVITEKVDGANFRFKRTNEGALLFGKRGGVFEDSDGNPMPIRDCNERFQPTMRYLYDTVDLDALDCLYDRYGELWFYGESLYEHSIDYDTWEGAAPSPDSSPPNFLGFDIYSVEQAAFLPYEAVTQVFDKIGLTTTPVVEQTTASVIKREGVSIPESAYRTPNASADNEFDRRGLAEGVVIRNLDNGSKAKYVHQSFSERNAIAFNDAEYAQSLSGAYVAAYVTDARIRKHIHKLLDDGRYSGVSMAMVETLVDVVVDDVIAEEGRTLSEGEFSGEIDSETEQDVRKKAKRKCEQVLRDVMSERQS